MTTTADRLSDVAPAAPEPVAADPRRVADWRRLRSGTAAVALSSPRSGRCRHPRHGGRRPARRGPDRSLVALLALCVVGGAAAGHRGPLRLGGRRRPRRGPAARRPARRRADQPLPVLAEQAVGEVLDRVDDDTHEVGALLRGQAWQAIRTLLGLGPLWVVAGLTWWPAVPAARCRRPGALGGRARCWASWPSARSSRRRPGPTTRRRSRRPSPRRTTCAPASARPTLVRRCTELRPTVHARFAEVVGLEARMSRRAGLLLHGAARRGRRRRRAGRRADGSPRRRWSRSSWSPPASSARSTSSPATCRTCRRASARCCGCASCWRRAGADRRPAGAGRAAGRGAPRRPLRLPGRPLRAAGRVAARPGRHHLRPRRTHRVRQVHPRLAAVARRRAGRGQVLLGGVDVLDLDLHALRAAVGVVTQRTEMLAGTLAENLALFEDVPRARVEAAVGELGLTAGSRGCRPGWTPCSARAAPPCPPARSSWSPSPGCWSATSGWSCSTRPPHGWTRSPRRASSPPPTGCSRGRTGLLVAHRLSTTERAEQVAVLEGGRVVQQGRRAELAAAPGPFRDLLAPPTTTAPDGRRHGPAARSARHAGRAAAGAADPGPGSSLARGTWRRWRDAGLGPARRGAVPGPVADRGLRRRHRLVWGTVVELPPGPPASVRCSWRSPPRCWSPRSCWPRRSAATRAGGSRSCCACAPRVLRRPDRDSGGWSAPRPARSWRAPSTPTATPSTPTAGSTSPTGWSIAAITRSPPAALLAGGVLLASWCCRRWRRAARATDRRPVRHRRLHRPRRASAGRWSRRWSRRAPSSSPPPPRTSGPPAPGRRRPGRRRGARAPRPGRARRRAGGHRAVRRRRRLGGLPLGRLGPGHRAARRRRGQRLRLVRPGRRRGRHRGPRHPRVDARDRTLRRRRRPDDLPPGRRPGDRRGARTRPARARAAAQLTLRGVTARPRRRDRRRARRRPRRARRRAGAAARARSARASPACWRRSPGWSSRDRRGPLERRRGRRPRDLPAPGPGGPRGAGAAGAVRHLHRQRPARPRPRDVLPALATRGWSATSPTPAARTPSSATAACGSPAVRCSGSRWPERSRPAPSWCWPTTSAARSTPPPRSSCGLRCGAAAARSSARRSKRAALARADRVVVLEDGAVADSGPWSELSARWSHLAS